MKITPHSPWYDRKQRLGEFKFTERIKEVPSMVLNGEEVQEGIKLVKGLPESGGAIIKDYDSNYTTAIMAQINPRELHAVILKAIPHDVGFQFLVGLRVHGMSDGALHPAQLSYEGFDRFLVLGVSEPTDYNAREGQTLHILVAHIKRKRKNGKIIYEMGKIQPIKLSPPGLGSSVGELDNLVEEMIEVDSKFNIGDLLYSPQFNDGESIGQLVNVVDNGSEEIATIVWENGEMEDVYLDTFALAKDKFSPERIENAERSIFCEHMMAQNADGYEYGLMGRKLQEGEIFLTAFANDHQHEWSFDKERTSKDKGEGLALHDHVIDVEKGLALEAAGHTHNLTLMKPIKPL